MAGRGADGTLSTRVGITIISVRCIARSKAASIRCSLLSRGLLLVELTQRRSGYDLFLSRILGFGGTRLVGKLAASRCLWMRGPSPFCRLHKPMLKGCKLSENRMVMTTRAGRTSLEYPIMLCQFWLGSANMEYARPRTSSLFWRRYGTLP